jgi:phosphatidylglycerol lysyltransferase
LVPITGFGHYFADSIYLVGTTTLGYALIQLIRPILIHHPSGGKERARAEQIVHTYGCSSLARLTLLNDKLYFFSSGSSVIAYVVKGRIALVLGDPIGPPEDFSAAIHQFQELCTRNDWRPAFYQALPEHLECYQEAGFDALCIGQEGIVDLATFSLEGRANKNFRTSINRLNKLGYSTQIYEPPLSGDLLNQLRSISDEWLSHMHGSEKQFSVGWFDDAYLRSSPVMVVVGPDGTLLAFANLVPEYQRNEVSIDLMRHRKDVEPGSMDFLFASLFLWSRGKGYASFSLGLSALSGIGENPQDPAVEKALHFIYEHIDRFYNFKGLHSFKEKFHPTWSPRYLIYPGLSSLPAISMALVRADSGDDLLEYLKR